MEHHIFALFRLLSATSSAFPVHHALLGLVLGLALFLSLSQLELAEGCAWPLINRKCPGCCFYTLCLPDTQDGLRQSQESSGGVVFWVAFLPRVNTCLLILHLSPGSTAASSTSSRFLLALVFQANKEERQGWGLFLLICPRGSLGIRINLQISGLCY